MSYTCPQCDGRLVADDAGAHVCDDCGLNMTDVLDHVEARDGPLADVAGQLREAL